MAPIFRLSASAHGPLEVQWVSCREHGIGVVPHSTLAKGLLTGRYKPGHEFPEDDERSEMAGFQGERFSQNLAMAEKLGSWAGDHGHSLVHLAITWSLANPAVTLALVGAKTPAQVDHIAEAAEWNLSADQLAEIAEILGDYAGVRGFLPALATTRVCR